MEQDKSKLTLDIINKKIKILEKRVTLFRKQIKALKQALKEKGLQDNEQPN